MSAADGPVQQLLKALSDQGDLIAHTINGSVTIGAERSKAVDALIRMRALLALDAQTYYLHPALREFISDSVAGFGAFKHLARLEAPITQLESEFKVLLDFTREGALRDAAQAQFRLEQGVVEIAGLLNRNLQLLSSKITTNFGDVESVTGKIRENRFYATQVSRFSRQLLTLDKKAQFIEGEALTHVLPDVRRIINVGILARLPDWSARITDIQRQVSKNLFTLRQMEARPRHLAAVALWLSKNQGPGFELEISAQDTIRLGEPHKLALSWNVDASDREEVVLLGLIEAAKRLPPVAEDAPPPPTAAPVVRQVEQTVAQSTLQPVDELIEQYLEYIGTTVTQQPQNDLSLLAWRERWGEALGVGPALTDEEWLLYACSQAAAAGYTVCMLARPRRITDLNECYTDAYALPQSRSGAGRLAG